MFTPVGTATQISASQLNLLTFVSLAIAALQHDEFCIVFVVVLVSDGLQLFLVQDCLLLLVSIICWYSYHIHNTEGFVDNSASIMMVYYRSMGQKFCVNM